MTDVCQNEGFEDVFCNGVFDNDIKMWNLQNLMKKLRSVQVLTEIFSEIIFLSDTTVHSKEVLTHKSNLRMSNANFVLPGLENLVKFEFALVIVIEI